MSESQEVQNISSVKPEPIEPIKSVEEIPRKKKQLSEKQFENLRRARSLRWKSKKEVP